MKHTLGAMALSLIAFPSVALADYWDCEISYSSQRWDMVAGGGKFTAELTAASRTEAENKARQNSWTVKEQGIFTSSNITICPSGYGGSQSYGGEKCYYGMGNVSCRRQ